MSRVFFLTFAIFCSLRRAQETDLPYIEMKPCDPAPYAKIRDYWDKTNTFCYEKNGQTIRMPFTDMGEIKLRDNGQWENNEYVTALSPENLIEVRTYEKYYVRYLSQGAAANGAVPFVAHVFFNWGSGTQTMYVFGEITSQGARLTGYSNGSNSDGDWRAAANTVKNLLEAFNGNNPSRLGVEQTKDEDVRRAKPVGEVVNKYQALKKTQGLSVP